MTHQILVGITQDIVVFGTVLGKIQLWLLEDADHVGQTLDQCRSFTQLVWIVEVREVTAGQSSIGIDQGLNDLGVDFVADVTLAFEGNHVFEAGALGNDHGWGEVVAVGVLVADVLDEQHEQDVVLVLTGIHTSAQLIAGGPKGGVKVGFLDGHVGSLSVNALKPPTLTHRPPSSKT
ncbi:hypothetical protein D9M70_444670 [compost metagenome]